jgi:hypothetical protein
MIRELHDVCADLEERPRLLLLTGAEGTFAAGADIGELRDRGRGRPRRRTAAAALTDVHHPPRPQPQRDADQVAAGGATGTPAGRPRQGLAAP